MKRYLTLLLLLLLYTIVIYHLIDYDNFPLSVNYQFPLDEIIKAYLLSAFLGVFVEWNYQSTFKKNKSNPKKRVIKFLSTTLIGCSAFFIAVYTIDKGKYSLYYGIISVLLTTVNLILWLTLIYGKALFLMWTKLDGPNSLNIKSGAKTYKVDLYELSHFSSKNKIVTAHLKSGKDIITNFNLKELEEILSNEFFRINRQLILNKDAIEVVKSAKNNTIEVTLKNQELATPLIVSRYRVPYFRKWFS